MPLSPTDRARIDELYVHMRPLVTDLVERAQATLDEADPNRWRVVVREAYRSPLRHMDAWRHGRTQMPTGSWKRIAGQTLLTYAQPLDCPHCVREYDGTPAALAVHVVITDASGVEASRSDVIRSVVHAVAWQAGPRILTAGACPAAAPGGGAWCVEWRDWEVLARDGVLLREAVGA